jgi:hypothetical protein
VMSAVQGLSGFSGLRPPELIFPHLGGQFSKHGSFRVHSQQG